MDLGLGDPFLAGNLANQFPEPIKLPLYWLQLRRDFYRDPCLPPMGRPAVKPV